jgi:hypothetical protein
MKANRLNLLLAFATSAAESTEEWLPGREGKVKNEPFTKLVIPRPTKSRNEIPLECW